MDCLAKKKGPNGIALLDATARGEDMITVKEVGRSSISGSAKPGEIRKRFVDGVQNRLSAHRVEGVYVVELQ
jgi:hypothetical protein